MLHFWSFFWSLCQFYGCLCILDRVSKAWKISGARVVTALKHMDRIENVEGRKKMFSCRIQRLTMHLVLFCRLPGRRPDGKETCRAARQALPCWITESRARRGHPRPPQPNKHPAVCSHSWQWVSTLSFFGVSATGQWSVTAFRRCYGWFCVIRIKCQLLKKSRRSVRSGPASSGSRIWTAGVTESWQGWTARWRSPFELIGLLERKDLLGVAGFEFRWRRSRAQTMFQIRIYMLQFLPDLFQKQNNCVFMSLSRTQKWMSGLLNSDSVGKIRGKLLQTKSLLQVFSFQSYSELCCLILSWQCTAFVCSKGTWANAHFVE